MDQVKALEPMEISSQSPRLEQAWPSGRHAREYRYPECATAAISTHTSLAKARYDTIINGLKLKSAAGTLKEEDLQQYEYATPPKQLISE